MTIPAVTTVIPALPTAPQRSDPETFQARSDAWLDAVETEFYPSIAATVTEINATTAGMNAAILDAQQAVTDADAAGAAQVALAAAQVTLAQNHADAAAASSDSANTAALAAGTASGADMWVSGATYALGDAAWSLKNYAVYRRIVPGAGTIDPSEDAVNWASIGIPIPPAQSVAGTTQAAVAGIHYVLINPATTTVTLPATPSNGDAVQVTVSNGLITNVVARNGNTIAGIAQDLVLDNIHATVYLVYLGSDWKLTGITDNVNEAAAASALQSTESADDAAASALAAAASSVSAASAAADAASAAVNAVVSVLDNGAPLWVSGTTYPYGSVAWSPIDKRVYRRMVAGAGTTDPSADPTNWSSIGTPTLLVQEISGTSVAAENGMHYALTNVAATTVTLPANPVQGDAICVSVCNNLVTNVIARNGQTIMGLAEDMTLDNAMLTITLKFIYNSWRTI